LTCGGIFCGSRSEYVGNFFSFIGVQKSFYVEAMRAIFVPLSLLGLSVTLSCFVKHLVRLISFFGL